SVVIASPECSRDVAISPLATRRDRHASLAMTQQWVNKDKVLVSAVLPRRESILRQVQGDRSKGVASLLLNSGNDLSIQ
ncbi:MAG: hypothetical protein AB1442_05765, partial [Nitrospirota bacterium]